MSENETTRHGRAPLKLAVVVVIAIAVLAISAAAVRSARRKAEILSQDLGCKARARAIATAVLTYHQAWEYWPEDTDYYVKLFGYRFSSEPGYYGEDPPWCGEQGQGGARSQAWAGGVTAFICPDDRKPRVNRHAIRSSYEVVAKPEWVDPRDETPKKMDKVLLVREVGERHRPGGKRSAPQGYHVYADLHAELGPPVPAERK